MEENELSPALRAAYDAAENEMEPSAFLRERTLRSLRERGIVGTPAHRHWWRTAALAVASGVVGLLLGIQVAGAPSATTPTATRAVAAEEDVGAALLEVQRTGTAHAHAVGRLVASLDRVDASTLAGAQEVYIAAQRAQEEYSQILLAGRSTARASDPAPDAPAPVIWF